MLPRIVAKLALLEKWKVQVVTGNLKILVVLKTARQVTIALKAPKVLRNNALKVISVQLGVPKEQVENVSVDITVLPNHRKVTILIVCASLGFIVDLDPMINSAEILYQKARNYVHVDIIALRVHHRAKKRNAVIVIPVLLELFTVRGGPENRYSFQLVGLVTESAEETAPIAQLIVLRRESTVRNRR